MRKFLPLILLVITACRCASTDLDRALIADRISRNVWIDITEADGREGSCSGVILETGKVLTAKHCLGATMAVNKEPATVLAQGDGDLMLLSCKTPFLPPLDIASVEVGDHIFAVFNEGDFVNLYDSGVVMKVEQQRMMVSTKGAPGYSGSGMYDSRGRLVGIGIQFSAAGFGNNTVGHYASIVFSIAVNADEIRKFLATVK